MPDSRFPNGFTPSPGASVDAAVSAREDNIMPGTTVGRDGVPYISRVSGPPLR